jgi:hypothetical protein
MMGLDIMREMLDEATELGSAVVWPETEPTPVNIPMFECNDNLQRRQRQPVLRPEEPFGEMVSNAGPAKRTLCLGRQPE